MIQTSLMDHNDNQSQPRAILLTGRPGAGKSTLIQKIINRLEPGVVGGFYTREVRHHGRRTGFEIVTLDVETALLASKDQERIPRGRPFGNYTVSLDAIDHIAVPALQRANDARQIVIIDEIGPMEILSPRFCQTVWGLLDQGRPLLGTIVARPYKFADEVKSHPGVEVKMVTPQNRERLVRELATNLAKQTAGWQT